MIPAPVSFSLELRDSEGVAPSSKSPEIRLKLEKRALTPTGYEKRLKNKKKLALEIENKLEKASSKREESWTRIQQDAKAHVERVNAKVQRTQRRKQEEKARQLARDNERHFLAANKRQEILQQKKNTARSQSHSPEPKVKKSPSKRGKSRERIQAELHEASNRRGKHLERVVNKVQRHLSNVESTKERVHAAKKIKIWMLKHRKLHDISSVLESQATNIHKIAKCWSNMQKISFEKAIMSLQNREIIKCATEFLQAAPRSMVLASRPEKFQTTRVFLTAGMIFAHPKDIMDGYKEENVGTSEYNASKRLLRASQLLVNEFLAISKLKSPAKQKEAMLRLDTFRILYADCFAEWKQIDAEKMVSEMLNTYSEMYAANYQATLQAEGNSQEDRLHEIIRRTNRQLAQLLKAVGNIIGKEQAEMRIDSIERIAREKLNSMATEQVIESSKSMDEMVDEKVQDKGSSSPPKSPPRDLKFTKNLFSNDMLAHELILDPTYEMKAPKPSEEETGQLGDLAKRLQVSMKKAFWDTMLAELSSVPIRTDILAQQLRDMRKEFLSIIGNSADVAEIEARLSDAAIDESLQDQSTDRLFRLFDYVLNKLLVNEAPARTETTRVWVAKLGDIQSASTREVKITVLPDIFMFLFEKFEQFRLDALNAHLRIIAPYLQRHGVEHEHKKFVSRVNEGKVSTNATKQWIVDQVKTHYGTFSDEMKTALREGNAFAYKKILATAFMALIDSYIVKISEGHPEIWPETFEMDVDRVREYRDNIDIVTIKAASVTLIRQALAKKGMTLSSQNAVTISRNLTILFQDASIKIPDIIAQIVSETRRVANGQMTDDDAKDLESMLSSVMQPSNAIFALFHKRVMTHINDELLRSSNEPLKLQGGLDLFAEDLTAITKKTRRLFDHNVAVFASYYNAFVQEALASLRS